MEFQKSYCGLAFHGQYLCIEREIKCQVSYEKCNDYFDEYKAKIVRRDV